MADYQNLSSFYASSPIIIPSKYQGLLISFKYYIFPSKNPPFNLGRMAVFCNTYNNYANFMVDYQNFSSFYALSPFIIPWKHQGLLISFKYYIFLSKNPPFNLGGMAVFSALFAILIIIMITSWLTSNTSVVSMTH